MRKNILLKMGSILLNIYGFLLFIMCVITVVKKENALPAILLAVLVCPCSYWYARKKWGERRPVLIRVIRGVILSSGCFVLGFILMDAPYFRCFNYEISSFSKEYFEKHIQTDELTYKEVSNIRKTEYGDYQEIAARIQYEARHTHQAMQRDIILYFDRMQNRYFETFEEMRQYRKEDPPMLLSHFNEAELQKRVYEVIDYVLEGNYDGIWPLVDEGCKAELTKEKREEQQQKIAPLGAYKQVSNFDVPLVEEDESGTQKMTILGTITFADGEAKIELVLDEELTILSLEIK